MRSKWYLKVALAIIAILMTAMIAAADGPVIWKNHCPRHHDVQIVPAPDWGGVNVLCIRSAQEVSK